MRYIELNDKAKRRALDWWQQDSDWNYEFTIDNAKENAPKGFSIGDIYFGGFWSQGDGCAWKGICRLDDWLDARTPTDEKLQHKYFVVRELMRNDWLDDRIYITYKVGWRMSATDFGGVYTPNEDSVIQTGVLKGASVAALLEGGAEALLDELIEAIVADAQAYADKIYEDLEADYEHHISEENFAEIADANNWEFDEDGVLL